MKMTLTLAAIIFWLPLLAAAESAPNLVVNSGFEEPGSNGQPAKAWFTSSPAEHLSPQFERRAGAGRDSSAAVAIRSNEKSSYKFGYIYQDVPVTAGKTYEFVVRCRTEGIDNPNRSVLVNLLWGADGHSDNFISNWTRERQWIEGRQRFQHRRGTVVRLMLLLRHEGIGTAIFDDIEVREVAAVPQRIAKVASYPAMPVGDDRRERATSLVPQIVKAKQEGCEIVCFTEGLNMGGPILKIAEPVNGPTCEVLSKAAAEQKIYVIAGIYERDGDSVYNSAILFDREGKVAGKYRKTHLHWPEMSDGVRPGDEYPVFECDFGKIGIMICFDSWFPEVSRVLALKGAEIIFCPNMGYDETVGIATACNTGAYFVSSSSGSTKVKNVLVGPDLKKLAYGGPELLVAELNLSEPKPYYYYQWQTCGMPQSFRQMTHRISDRVLEEMLELYRSVPTATTKHKD